MPIGKGVRAGCNNTRADFTESLPSGMLKKQECLRAAQTLADHLDEHTGKPSPLLSTTQFQSRVIAKI